MTEYELNRNLARAIYALALDAVNAGDREKTAAVESIKAKCLEPYSGLG